MPNPVDHRPVASIPHRLSRRHALTQLGAGSLGRAHASRPLAAAQSPTTGALPEIIHRNPDAFNSADPAALDALYTDDAIYEDVPTLTQSEPGAVDAFIGAFMEQVSDIHIEWTSGFRTEEWGAAEGTFSFRYTGQFPGLPPGTGEEISNRFATIFEFEGDLIRRSSDYFDNTGLLFATGILQAPAEEPSATPQT